MTERGAAADNACRIGAREAQGLCAKGPARPGTPTPLKTWVPESRRAKRANRKARQGSFAGSLAPPGAPIPRFEGDGKRDTGTPAARKSQGAGRRSFASAGCLKIESEPAAILRDAVLRTAPQDEVQACCASAKPNLMVRSGRRPRLESWAASRRSVATTPARARGRATRRAGLRPARCRRRASAQCRARWRGRGRCRPRPGCARRRAAGTA